MSWWARPLEKVYAAVFIDAIMVKIRDGQVRNRPIYAAIGVDLAGHRDVLGMWAGEGDGESAKYWLAVLTELKNRGVADIFFLVCDADDKLVYCEVWPGSKARDRTRSPARSAACSPRTAPSGSPGARRTSFAGPAVTAGRFTASFRGPSKASFTDDGRRSVRSLFQQPRHQLDLAVAQRLPHGFSLRLSAKNLLNSPVQIIQKGTIQAGRGPGFPTGYVEGVTFQYRPGTTVSLSVAYSH